MFAKSSDVRGFTLPELAAVLVIVGVLAVVALPRLQGALSFRDDAFRDEIVAALRTARSSAIAHRRLVCASVGATAVRLELARVNPAAACDSALAGPDGSADFARSRGDANASAGPTAVLYFQPSGRVTLDGAGATPGTWSIAVSGGVDAITVVGETGHVR